MSRVVGILIGGRAARMGGAAKGMLPAPDGVTIAARTRDLFLCEGACAVLLGKNSAYDSLSLASLEDAPDASGPLAGLLALVRRAREVDPDADRVFLVGGDMPHLTEALVRKLATSTSHAIAPKTDDRWEPLFSSFSLSRIQDIEDATNAGARAPSAILDALHADTLALTPSEEAALEDWDTPEDVARDRHARARAEERSS